LLSASNTRELLVFDVRPEQLLEIIVSNLSSMLPVISRRE
jgi:hypothetical protein